MNITIENIKVNNKILLKNDKIPYLIMAKSNRYAIAVRKLNRRQDADLIKHEVAMYSYSSFKEAYESSKEYPIYTILDFQLGVRGADNMAFGIFDYFDRKDCEKAIKYLEFGEMEISYRNRVKLDIEKVM